jgi:PKD repeat protein
LSVDFTWTASGLRAQFNNATQGPVRSWHWAFGDGLTSNRQNPSHTWRTAGTWTVTLVATPWNGAPVSVSHDVTVAGG